jgi:hypothetical protein
MQAEALKSAFTGQGVTDAVGTQISEQMSAVINESMNSLKLLGPQLQTAIDQAVEPLSTIEIRRLLVVSMVVA